MRPQLGRFASGLALCLLSPVWTVAQAVKEQPTPNVGDFVLYAERSIQLGERNHAERGDVGVRTALALKQGSQLSVGRHDECRNLFSPSTMIEHDAKVGSVATNSLKRDPDSKIGAESKFPADMPPLPLAAAAGAGVDVTVEHHKELSLTPGTYGEVRLHHHSALHLAPGKYIVASLKMDRDSKLWAERGGQDARGENGPVDLKIVGGLWMGGHAKIGPRDDDAKANEFTIEVAGADPGVSANDDGLGPRHVVSIGREARVHALLAAPHGTVGMAHEARLKGAIAGFDIVTEARVHAEFESGFPVSPPDAHGSQQLQGYFGAPPDPAVAALASPVPPSTTVDLSIGLPVRNPAGLQSFLNQVSDPTQHNYRHFLTQAQFTATFGATAADYTTVVNWAKANGLTVTRTYSNNLLVDVSGTASQVEEALFVNLLYRLRSDGSQFVSTDRNPSLNLTVPLLHISGMTDFITPRPANFNGTPTVGSYWGWDFRNAYLGIGTPCAGLTGTGETIGLFELDSFLQSDLNSYDTVAGAVTVQNLTPLPTLIPPVNGSASLGSGQTEVTLDIEIAQSMAPGASIIVFEGSTGSTHHGDSILHAMATSSPPLTIGSSSWFYGWNPNGEQAMAQMAAEGVSYFQASGDNGSIGDPTDDRDMQNQTLVGGTALQTNALIVAPPATPSYPSPSLNGVTYYNGDTTWTGSGGGFMNGGTQQCWPWPFCTSASTGIPGYQVGVSMATNGGSTTFRNFPDVSMDAFMTALVNGSPNPQVGTSEATPMWAGFTALANQQAVANGVGRVGFANPVIYAIGLTANQPAPNLYTQTFNDVADNGSTGTFQSVTGYDLVTGWGTPQCNLITQLASPAPLNPASFPEIQIHVNSGDDGIRDNSIASVTVNFNGGIPPLVNTFHPQNATGWDDKGLVHDLILPLPESLAANDIHDVTFALTSTSCCIGNTCCDNWTIGGLDVRLFLPPRGPEACVFHGEATQLGRLTHSNPTAAFTPAGCSSAPGTPPPTVPVSEAIFVFGTGNDDLRSGSELDVSFFRPDATLIESGVLKASGAPKFDNNTQNTEVYTFTTGPHKLSDIGSIAISMNNSGNDEWHIYGINVVADTPGGPQSCLFDAQGEPLQVLNSGTLSMTLSPGAGCP
jgi:Pro-kumamolisin, activation domain